MVDSSNNNKTISQGLVQIQTLYDELFDSTTIQDFAFASDDYLPKFDTAEITKGKVLGEGGFGTVYEIRGFAGISTHYVSPSQELGLDYEYDQSTSQWANAEVQHNSQRFQQAARAFLAQHCLRTRKASSKKIQGDARYALKVLREEKGSKNGNNPQHFLQGTLDMKIEARFLAALQHPNIIKVRGMARCENPKDGSFGHCNIVMDRLYDTLDQRLQGKWRSRGEFYKTFAGKVMFGQKSRDTFWEKRLVYAFDLSAALAYLHQKRIVYRDLKPENVGFDCRDDIKLFDFGLCRELKASDRVPGGEDLYRLTKATGSPRYMAPEVALGQPYNEACDVYSFALLLWQMLALQTPFEVYNMSKLKQRVWGDERKRPDLQNKSWSKPLKQLLEQGWAHEIVDRCSMRHMEDSLLDICTDIRGSQEGLEHERRRSTFVMEDSVAVPAKELQNANNYQLGNASPRELILADLPELSVMDSDSDYLLEEEEALSTQSKDNNCIEQPNTEGLENAADVSCSSGDLSNGGDDWWADGNNGQDKGMISASEPTDDGDATTSKNSPPPILTSASFIVGKEERICQAVSEIGTGNHRVKLAYPVQFLSADLSTADKDYYYFT